MIFYINCLYEGSKHEHMINEWGCEEISVESLVVESNFELACIAAYFVQAYDIYNKNKRCAIYGSIRDGDVCKVNWSTSLKLTKLWFASTDNKYGEQY